MGLNMADKGFSRISVSLPQELLREFEEIAKRRGYGDRSKAIRAAMRDLIAKSKWMHKEQGVVAGALVMAYNHGAKGLEETLTDIQHRYGQTVRSVMHVHLDEKNCLEIIAVKGEAKEIRELSQKLTLRGVKQLKRSIITPI